MVKEKSNSWIAWCLLALVAGLIVGGLAFSKTEIEYRDALACEPVDCTPVACLAENCPECICDECTESEASNDYLEIAIDEAFEEILDDYKNGYDEDEISWYGSIEDEWTLIFDDEDWELTFQRSVKYKDDFEKEIIDYEFIVSYDADDDEYDVDVTEL